jgi:hypothetical protein
MWRSRLNQHRLLHRPRTQVQGASTSARRAPPTPAPERLPQRPFLVRTGIAFRQPRRGHAPTLVLCNPVRKNPPGSQRNVVSPLIFVSSEPTTLPPCSIDRPGDRDAGVRGRVAVGRGSLAWRSSSRSDGRAAECFTPLAVPSIPRSRIFRVCRASPYRTTAACLRYSAKRLKSKGRCLPRARARRTAPARAPYSRSVTLIGARSACDAETASLIFTAIGAAPG